MPHLQFEVTQKLASALDFGQLMRAIHRQMAQQGYARMDDLKSRVHRADISLTGDDPQGEFVVVRLITTNPRTPETRHAMAQLVHDLTHDAISALKPDYWWQCCVLVEAFERADYIKTDSRG